LNDRLTEARVNMQRAQERLAFGLARLSPAAAFSLAVTRLARTSLELKQRFHEAALAYKNTYGRFIFDKTGMNTGGHTMIFRQRDGKEEEEKPIDATELPVFTFVPATLPELAEDAVVDMGLLALVNLLVVGGAFLAFTRYDVR
jgi:hypothetical protein